MFDLTLRNIFDKVVKDVEKEFDIKITRDDVQDMFIILLKGIRDNVSKGRDVYWNGFGRWKLFEQLDRTELKNYEPIEVDETKKRGKYKSYKKTGKYKNSNVISFRLNKDKGKRK